MEYDPDRCRATEQRLTRDPNIRRMARDIAASGEPKSDFAHHHGTPRARFANAVNDRYRQLGGEDTCHPGAVATAILAIAYPEDE